MAAGRDWTGLVGWCEPAGSDRALDVAGGPGSLAAALLPRVGSMTVLDASARLLEFVPDGVGRALGRAEQLPFDDAGFDLVTCVNSLHHIARPPRALDEMARVLAPGGRIVLEDFIADDDPARARRWEEIERIRDPEHGRLITAGSRATAARGRPRPGRGGDVASPLRGRPWLEVAGCGGRLPSTAGADRCPDVRAARVARPVPAAGVSQPAASGIVARVV
jgi:SAM-dependent methyltransferase